MNGFFNPSSFFQIKLDDIVKLAVYTVLLFFIYLKTKRKSTLKQQEVDKQKLYQISVLKEIQDKISYSLDIEEVIDIITRSLKNLFPYSTASSMVVKQDKIVFKTYVEENISHVFLEQVKKSMLASITTLIPEPPTEIEEKISGASFDEMSRLTLESFFHIPLIIGNKVVGLINISSTTPNLYREESVTTLYQIVENATNAFTKLRQLLETEENKLTSMIKSLADGVFMVNDKNELLIINETARKYLKLDKPNPTFADLMSVFSGQYNLSGKIDDCIKNKREIEENEVTVEENTYQIFITPVSDSKELEAKSVIGASILIHDITVEKNLSKIKEDFTNMMVHDLRAPLTAIKDSAELMLEEKTMKKDEQEQLIGIINTQARMLLNQIGSILDASKIEAGRFYIQKAPNDLNVLISEVVESFIPIALKHKIEVNSYIPVPLPKFNFDKIKITQVLNNLMSNSLKFTPDGGKITIFGEINEGFVTISVSDTGMGISEEDQKDLFSKFYQIRKTPYELAKKGSGLGLFIVKGIVEAHEGKVSVKSEVNHGTTISFTLPVSEDIFHQTQGYIDPLPTIKIVN
jgi:signal transduction histidine kinase